MNIAINCRFLSHSPQSGIGRHLTNYIEHIGAILRNDMFYLYTERELKQTINISPNMNIVKLPLAKIGSNNALSNLHEQMILNNQFKKHHIDIYHNVDWLPAFQSNVKTIITLHDLAYYLYPQKCHGIFKKNFNFIYKLLLTKALKRANLILTVSQFAKKEIELNFPFTNGKVEFIYNSVNDSYFKNGSIASGLFPQGIEIPDKYILYVGSDDIRKNLSRLIEAFTIFKVKWPNDYKLVLIGNINIGGLLKKVDHVIRKSIIWFPSQPANVLKLFYQKARATYLISTYEGFGMPAIESMACETPVVLSDIELFREIEGDVAYFVNPFDINKVAESMKIITQADEVRMKLSVHSKLAAEKFTARKAAEKLAEIYIKVKGL